MGIIKIEKLEKSFGSNRAVDKLSLEIFSGEIYGLLGPNGAGKSTLINIISGLLKKNEGSIEIFEKDMKKFSMDIKRDLGIVPQDLAIYEDLTAMENVKFFASLYGLKGEQLKKNAEEALEFVGLLDKSKEFSKKFSGGMKRRLNIACAIAHKPKLIIMDEPTVGIDPQSRNHILQSVKKLNKAGCTIVYTSHYMEEVEEICTRIGIIDHGKLIAEGTKEELKELIQKEKTVIFSLEKVENVNIDELRSISGVINAAIDNNILKVTFDKNTNILDKVILNLSQNQVEIKDVETKTPDLEAVFLTLTGRTLRD